MDTFDALIVDASSRQSLVCTRSLGRAGLRLALGEASGQADPTLPILSFQSRYCRHRQMLPAFEGDGAAYAGAVIEFVRQHPVRAVLATSDAAIAALAPVRDTLAGAGAALGLAPDPALTIANDKDLTLALARELGIACPKTMQVRGGDDIAAIGDLFGYPVVLKPTRSWTGGSRFRLQPVEVINAAEAAAAVTLFLEAGAGVLAQEWAGGAREGVTLFIVGEQILVSCGHVVYRTMPALGGVSAVRESVPVPPDLYGPAVSLALRMGVQGPCEVEFRRTVDGRPLLMELNARLAGTIENVTRSGIDLPMMLWRWASGQPVPAALSYRTGVRTRWLQGDMRWLRDNKGKAGRPDAVPGGKAVRMFASEFFRTRHYDTMDWRDLGPVIAEARQMATGLGRVSRLARRRTAGAHRTSDAGRVSAAGQKGA